MRQMIQLRKRHHVFGRGTMQFVKPENRKVFAFTREFEGEMVLCVFNLSQHAQFAELDLRHYRGRMPVEMLGDTDFPRVGELPYLLTLSPCGFYWFLLRD